MKESGASGLRTKTTTYFTVIARTEPLWWYKTYGSPFVRAGTPDFLLNYNGVFGALELKREGERPTHKQMHELEEIDRCGGLAGWTDSMPGVRLFLDTLRTCESNRGHGVQRYG